MRAVVGLMCVVVIGFATLADTVETLDGQILDGRRVVGLPESITVEDAGVLAEVDSARVLSLSLSGDQAEVLTITSVDLVGNLDLPIASITLVTETGETNIPIDRVASIIFDRRVVQPKATDTIAILSDGRTFAGDLTGFPTELTLDSAGIRTTTRLRSMESVVLGDPVTIDTESGSLSGTLITSLPVRTVLRTQFGRYRIPTETIVSLEMSHRGSVSSGEASANVLGVGLKLRGALPFLEGNLVLGNLGINAAIGFGASTVSGLGTDVTALWYSGAARYLVRIDGLDQFVRPHLGAGILGLTASASAGGASASASGFGIDAGLGVDVSLAFLGVPLTLFAGNSWSFLGGASASSFEFGIRLDFGL